MHRSDYFGESCSNKKNKITVQWHLAPCPLLCKPYLHNLYKYTRAPT